MATRSKRSAKSAPKTSPAAKSAKGAKAPADRPKVAVGGRAGKGAANAGRPRARGQGSALVIVESPTKAKTIGKYLGSGYDVKATIGHVRDLPTRELGVDVEHGFEPKYVTIKGK